MDVKEALTPTERQAFMDDFLQTLLDIARTPVKPIHLVDIRDTFTDEEVCQEPEERISDQTGFAE